MLPVVRCSYCVISVGPEVLRFFSEVPPHPLLLAGPAIEEAFPSSVILSLPVCGAGRLVGAVRSSLLLVQPQAPWKRGFLSVPASFRCGCCILLFNLGWGGVWMLLYGEPNGLCMAAHGKFVHERKSTCTGVICG